MKIIKDYGRISISLKTIMIFMIIMGYLVAVWSTPDMIGVIMMLSIICIFLCDLTYRQ